MHKSLCLSLAALMTASTLPAAAQDYGRTYWAVNLGAGFPPDQEIDGTFGDDTADDFAPFVGEVEFDPGFFGSIVWGNKISGAGAGGFSIEAEGFYQALNPDRIDLGAANIILDPDDDLGTGDDDITDDDLDEFFVGDASVFGGMVNLVYTLDTETPWRPRIGAGAGYGRVSFDIDEAFDDGDGVFVYQGFVGLGYALSRSTEIQTNVRYFGASNPDFEDDRFDAEGQLDNIVATVGLVWRL